MFPGEYLRVQRTFGKFVDILIRRKGVSTRVTPFLQITRHISQYNTELDCDNRELDCEVTPFHQIRTLTYLTIIYDNGFKKGVSLTLFSKRE